MGWSWGKEGTNTRKQCSKCKTVKKNMMKDEYERRSALPAEEYRKHLAVLDQRYHGTRQGETAPLVRRLEELWPVLVVRAFQEGSDDIHALGCHTCLTDQGRGERSTILTRLRPTLPASLTGCQGYGRGTGNPRREEHRSRGRGRGWRKKGGPIGWPMCNN